MSVTHTWVSKQWKLERITKIKETRVETPYDVGNNYIRKVSMYTSEPAIHMTISHTCLKDKNIFRKTITNLFGPAPWNRIFDEKYPV